LATVEFGGHTISRFEWPNKWFVLNLTLKWKQAQ